MKERRALINERDKKEKTERVEEDQEISVKQTTDKLKEETIETPGRWLLLLAFCAIISIVCIYCCLLFKVRQLSCMSCTLLSLSA
jgi:hypothetical protein